MTRTYRSYLTALLAVIFFCASALTAEAIERIKASGHQVNKILNCSASFSEIHSTSIIDVVYTKGPQKVKARAPENVMPYVVARVKDNVLTLSLKRGISITGVCRITVTVSAPYVDCFRSDGTGNITIESDISGRNSMTIISNGTGEITSKRLSAPKVKLLNNGTGAIASKGIDSSDATLILNGTNDISVASVTSNALNINLNGTGNVSVASFEGTQLSASLTGTGDINIQSGHTVTSRLLNSGTGYLKSIGLKAARVTADCTSTGDISCYATELLDALTTGTGEIRWDGPGRLVDRTPDDMRR